MSNQVKDHRDSQIELLIEIIEGACKAAGIVADWAQFNGPQALMFGKDLIKHVTEQADKIENLYMEMREMAEAADRYDV